MINLLPPEIKQKILVERTIRAAVFFCSVCSVIVCIGIALLAAPWFVLRAQEENLKNQYDILLQAPAFLRAETLEKDLALLYNKVALFEKNQIRALRPSRVVAAIKKHSEGIRIESFSYDGPKSESSNPQFRMKGNASDRDTLLAFIDALEEETLITNVRSPISNLLQGKDIEFLLTFDIVRAEAQFKP